MKSNGKFSGIVAIILLAAVFLSGQAVLFAHELEHGLAGESDTCVICLHANHDSNAVFTGLPVFPLAQELPHLDSPLISTHDLFFRTPCARAPPSFRLFS